MVGRMDALKFNLFDVAVLSRTLYGEASDQDDDARAAVAWSAVNRVRLGTFHGGRSIAGVCLARRQYDCWDTDTPDCVRMLDAGSGDAVLGQCTAVALDVLSGKRVDITEGAVFYHDETRDGPPSIWGVVHLTATIGKLKFYAPGTAPPATAERDRK
jgi:hypothetical protein